MTPALVSHLLQQYNIQHYGFTPLGKPLSFPIYEQWIKDQLHGEMHYLKEHLLQKETPQTLLASAQNAIVFTLSYNHPPAGPDHLLFSQLKIAKYAHKTDYHRWLKEIVDNLCLDFKKIFPDDDFIGFTDSSPVMERDLAHRAGLGWFGKNSCLISRQKGSLFLIAEIYTSLNLPPQDALSPDHCGHCTRCLDACPTNAILDNRTLDSTKCISYWTIEAKQPPPPQIRDSFQGWFFGCDICQDVCPWNKKHDPAPPSLPKDKEQLICDLRWIISSSHKEIERRIFNTPLQRARGKGLKRNALIVIANFRLHELINDVKSITNPDLIPLAQWTLQTLDNN